MAAERAKRSDQNKAWYGRSLERRVNTRAMRRYIMIVCEGKCTEPNYFESLKDTLPRNLVHVEPVGAGDNTLSLVKLAVQIWKDTEIENLGRRYDELWVVFDRDSFPAHRFDAAIQFCEKKLKAAEAQPADVKPEQREPMMRSAWSNESFELWYVLHFEDRKTAMPREDCNKALSKYLGEKYDKTCRDMYQKLQKSGSEAQALKRAKRLLKESRAAENKPSKSNPCTTVFELVEKLNEFKSS